jgi:hypothetical protein
VASVRLDGEGRPTELLLPGYGTADLPSSSFSTPQGVLPIRVEVRGAGVAIAALDQGFAWVRP